MHRGTLASQSINVHLRVVVHPNAFSCGRDDTSLVQLYWSYLRTVGVKHHPTRLKMYQTQTRALLKDPPPAITGIGHRHHSGIEHHSRG